MASWAVLRQVYAPLAVCRSTLLEAWSLVAIYGPTPRHVAIWAGFNALVLVLQARRLARACASHDARDAFVSSKTNRVCAAAGTAYVLVRLSAAED